MSNFWDKVIRCAHTNFSDYSYFLGTCSTPYCGGIDEWHCLDCGIFIQECRCHSNNWMDGWSHTRRKAHENKRKSTQQEVG